MTTSPDIFDDETLATDEIMAIVLDQEGEEGLRELLASIELDRETLEDIAGKLAAVGLPGASIVLEATAEAPSKAELELTEALENPHSGNRRAYLRAAYQRGTLTLDDLIARGVDADTLDFVAGGVVIRRKGRT